MHGRIIIRHEPVPQSGSYEVRFADGRASIFFYFDDVLGRRLRPDILTSEQALEQVKARGLSGTRTLRLAHFAEGVFCW